MRRYQLDTLKTQIDAIEVSVERIGIPRTPTEEGELRSQQDILAQYRNSYANLVQSYENIRLLEIQSLDNVAVARAAVIPDEPIASTLFINIILGLIIGISSALAAITLIEYLDDSIRDPIDLQETVNNTLTGTIKAIPEVDSPIESIDDTLITLHEPRHPISESYRMLRTNLRFASLGERLDRLMIASPLSGEGKSTTVANLAISLAQTGQRVLTIDADLRKPTQHSLFNLNSEPGLVDMLFLQETSH